MYKLIEKIPKYDSFSSVSMNDKYLGFSDGNKMKLYEKSNIGRIKNSNPIIELNSNNTIIQLKLSEKSKLLLTKHSHLATWTIN